MKEICWFDERYNRIWEEYLNKSNIYDGAFFTKIINIVYLLAIFSKKVHRRWSYGF